MYPFVFFILLLALLFFLSHVLTQSVFRLLYLLTKRKSLTVALFSLLFFPGVFIHELSHFLAAIFSGVRVGRMEFLPQFQDGGLKLGSVEIGKTDPIRRFFIGVAPLIAGMILIIAALYFYENIPASAFIRLGILFYILFEVGNTMYSSKKDMEGALELFLFLIILIFILFFLGIKFPTIPEDNTFYAASLSLVRQGNAFILFPIGIDSFFIVVMRVFIKLLS